VPLFVIVDRAPPSEISAPPCAANSCLLAIAPDPFDDREELGAHVFERPQVALEGVFRARY
jgi:hypothetical protein